MMLMCLNYYINGMLHFGMNAKHVNQFYLMVDFLYFINFTTALTN